MGLFLLRSCQGGLVPSFWGVLLTVHRVLAVRRKKRLLTARLPNVLGLVLLLRLLLLFDKLVRQIGSGEGHVSFYQSNP